MALIVKDANDTDRYLKKGGDGSVSTPFSDFANDVGDGRKTVTTNGTRVPLSATSVPCKRVHLRALWANADVVVAGGATCIAATLTQRGYPMLPGDYISLEVNDLNKVYIDSQQDGDGVTFTYEVMS